jgi:hypothetical protein
MSILNVFPGVLLFHFVVHMALVLMLITAVMVELTVLTLQMRILSSVEMRIRAPVNFQTNQNMETTKSLIVRRLTLLPFVSKFLTLLHLTGLS